MSRILDYIAKYDEKLTIADLKKAIEQDEISQKEKETEEINLVKNEFENTYLKIIDETRIFGRTLQVYNLGNFVRTDRNTDWELLYSFEGKKICFSERDIWDTVFNTDRVDNRFSAKQLRKMIKISKEEFEMYNSKYNSIKEDLKNLIK